MKMDDAISSARAICAPSTPLPTNKSPTAYADSKPQRATPQPICRKQETLETVELARECIANRGKPTNEDFVARYGR
jgi:hypothetical protein